MKFKTKKKFQKITIQQLLNNAKFFSIIYINNNNLLSFNKFNSFLKKYNFKKCLIKNKTFLNKNSKITLSGANILITSNNCPNFNILNELINFNYEQEYITLFISINNTIYPINKNLLKFIQNNKKINFNNHIYLLNNQLLNSLNKTKNISNIIMKNIITKIESACSSTG